MTEKQKWPLANAGDLDGQVIIKSFAETEDIAEYKDCYLIITEGWVEGDKAAVLRGGVNARAVLDIMQQAGIKHANIFHKEEQISHLEDIFLSTVVAPAHNMFDNVCVNWRHDSSIFDLIKNVGQNYSMLFIGAPFAVSEIATLYKKMKSVYSGKITFVRGPIQDIEFDEGDTIYKWVRECTFDGSDFALPNILRSYKKRHGQKIAVVLPSLNEEKTVGKVIRTALEVKEAGVIDEVILVDSQSKDNTVEIAKSYGIPVYLHPQIKPELGCYHGKGEAMYKSAFVSDADILAWVDTDIENITPRFFYGLIGPMLLHPEIRFVKGYFSRPVRVEASGVELGGGRVTEILVRPWINTYRPELSGYIQPLAGTVAIYKDTLQKMRIPVNYGVEIAMLLQAVENEGLWSTCQVNLGEVIHRSKDVEGLSMMAFQILQVLSEMELKQADELKNNCLRRVYSTHGHFEINSKRFHTVWRTY